MQMRVFLRNKQNRLYWGNSSGWVAEREHALDFSNVQRAARYALAERSTEMEIVLTCDLRPEEIIMPVLPEYEIEGRVTALERRVKALEDQACRGGSHQSVSVTGTTFHGNWQSVTGWPRE